MAGTLPTANVSHELVDEAPQDPASQDELLVRLRCALALNSTASAVAERTSASNNSEQQLGQSSASRQASPLTDLSSSTQAAALADTEEIGPSAGASKPDEPGHEARGSGGDRASRTPPVAPPAATKETPDSSASPQSLLKPCSISYLCDSEPTVESLATSVRAMDERLMLVEAALKGSANESNPARARCAVEGSCGEASRDRAVGDKEDVKIADMDKRLVALERFVAQQTMAEKESQETVSTGVRTGTFSAKETVSTGVRTSIVSAKETNAAAPTLGMAAKPGVVIDSTGSSAKSAATSTGGTTASTFVAMTGGDKAHGASVVHPCGGSISSNPGVVYMPGYMPGYMRQRGLVMVPVATPAFAVDPSKSHHTVPVIQAAPLRLDVAPQEQILTARSEGMPPTGNPSQTSGVFTAGAPSVQRSASAVASAEAAVPTAQSRESSDAQAARPPQMIMHVNVEAARDRMLHLRESSQSCSALYTPRNSTVAAAPALPGSPLLRFKALVSPRLLPSCTLAQGGATIQQVQAAHQIAAPGVPAGGGAPSPSVRRTASQSPSFGVDSGGNVVTCQPQVVAAASAPRGAAPPPPWPAPVSWSTAAAAAAPKAPQTPNPVHRTVSRPSCVVVAAAGAAPKSSTSSIGGQQRRSVRSTLG